MSEGCRRPGDSDSHYGIEYLAVGHVTSDLLPGGGASLGGAVTYAAVTASRLGLEAAVATRADPAFLSRHPVEGVWWHNGSAPSTTTFSNTYSPAGHRRQVLMALAPRLRPDDVPAEWRRARILHVAPVVNEVGDDVVDVVSAGFVGVSAQGWTRSAGPDGHVAHVPLRLPPAVRDRADAVVVSQEDLGARPQAADELAELVPVVVVTMSSAGARALAGGREHYQPAFPAAAADPTGAGDVFAAAFFIYLSETSDLPTSLEFAAAAAALAVEAPGLLGIGAREAVLARQRG